MTPSLRLIGLAATALALTACERPRTTTTETTTTRTTTTAASPTGTAPAASAPAAGTPATQASDTSATGTASSVSVGTGSASTTAAPPRQQFTGSVTGDAMVRHRFTARAGQTITVTREGTGVMPYFNLTPPGGAAGDQLFVGAMSDGQRWSGKAPTSGDYTIEVYQRGQAKDGGQTNRYTITVEVA